MQEQDNKGCYLNRPNTRWIYYQGVVLHLRGWSEALHINYKTLSSRLNQYGWSIQKALTTGVRGKANVII